MHTVVIVEGGSPVPRDLQEVIEAGSTSVEQVRGGVSAAPAADRLLVWRADALRIGDRWLRWPEEADEIRMVLQTGG